MTIFGYLSKDEELKNTFSGIYFWKKFNGYLWNYSRIDNSLKWEFLEHFSKEFKEYYEQNLLDLELLDKKEKYI